MFQWLSRKFKPLAIVVGVLLVQHAALACPNCKDNFDLNTTQGNIGAAYGYTIYFMILLPIVIVTTIAIKIKRQIDVKNSSAQSAEPCR
ncbi:MAG: hypothetical protein RML40_10530 [Bacteroidota bacterium]|nr:hypothetical protein [Candidatus Kapabacteria bacterium]MDW8220949.1 hypothetical protein [Bacteroidota bacterium]